MAKEYQPMKNNPYELPYPVYMQALWLVRDYKRMQMEYDDVIWDSHSPLDGQPKGNKIDKPTERQGVRRAILSTRIKAVDNAINHVPEEYRKGVLNSIIRKESYPMDAHRSTYSKYKSKFLYKVAENLSWM